MAITLVATSSVQNAALSADIVVTKPTGTTDGDLLVAMVMADGIAGTHTSVPTGWNSLIHGNPPSAFHAYVYYKVASSEGASWTWTASSAGRKLSGMAVAVRGQHATALTALHAYPASVDAGASSTDSVASTITTTVPNCLLVYFSSLFHASGGGAISGTVPSGMTEKEDNNPDQASARTGAYVATQDLAAAGATGTRTMVQSVADVWACCNIALRPADPPAPVIGMGDLIGSDSPLISTNFLVR